MRVLHITEQSVYGGMDFYQFLFPGNKVPVGMVEGVLHMFGGTL